jgi:hypothetical protein
MTAQQIAATLPALSTGDLHEIERKIHELYRQRNEPVIYDDDYGIWTAEDQASAAAEVFALLDEQDAD